MDVVYVRIYGYTCHMSQTCSALGLETPRTRLLVDDRRPLLGFRIDTSMVILVTGPAEGGSRPSAPEA
jgi:hypothetical protein